MGTSCGTLWPSPVTMQPPPYASDPGPPNQTRILHFSHTSSCDALQTHNTHIEYTKQGKHSSGSTALVVPQHVDNTRTTQSQPCLSRHRPKHTHVPSLLLNSAVPWCLKTQGDLDAIAHSTPTTKQHGLCHLCTTHCNSKALRFKSREAASKSLKMAFAPTQSEFHLRAFQALLCSELPPIALLNLSQPSHFPLLMTKSPLLIWANHTHIQQAHTANNLRARSGVEPESPSCQTCQILDVYVLSTSTCYCMPDFPYRVFAVGAVSGLSQTSAVITSKAHSEV